MAVGCFVDKTHRPEPDELGQALGGALPLWDELTGFLKGGCGCDGELRFYGKSYGWALRFKKWGWALASIYPGEGYFTAQIVLSPRLVAQAAELPLATKTKGILEKTRDYPEGRWLYVPVSSKEDVEDVQRLVSLKFRRRGA